ncbi:outer membrane protein transport protein [Marivita sp. GX14005]|uniref:OmpP1/FadL family transporter n=1 Tax=Marivita sp. GX14005 TaxID=2942276 RepID=UPI002018C8DF|nr:outer membrane protein transport protein [Marivita sp. GX14005]MCL3883638.1 outer membrane protein transport protein [Marivita sp. GX14005]
MTRLMTSAFALAVAAGAAQAGGIERMSNDYGLLFESGNKVRLSFSAVSPDVSGEYTPELTAAGGGQDKTGDMAESYQNFGFAYKNDINEKLAFGLYVNTPYGADSDYSKGVYTGLAAEWDSQQIAALARYRINDRVSVYGGARYLRSKAEITIPDLLVRSRVGGNAQAIGARAQELGAQAAAAQAAGNLAEAQALGAQAQQLGAKAQRLGGAAQDFGTSMEFNASADYEGDWGAVLGVAYEIPDIALRVALTYESEITHTFDASETIPGLGIDTEDGENDVTIPQTVALDFQTGVAPGTLVFGQIKWSEWEKWSVATPQYEDVTGGEITSFPSDVWTYKLGVGRQFTDAVSGFAQITYEPDLDDIQSRLAPRDGIVSLGIGGQYKMDNMTLRGGIEYAWVGDAEDASGVKFEDNNAIGIGLTLTTEF